MLDGKLIQRAAITGIILQLTLVIVGHYVDWIKANAYEFGGMMISGVAGLLYARDYAKGYARGALGGAITQAEPVASSVSAPRTFWETCRSSPCRSAERS